MLAMTSMIFPAFGKSDKEALVLKPTSSWNIDYADDRCRLARQFGEGEQKVFAFFDRYGPDDFFKLTLAGKPVSTWAEKAEAEVQFGPAEAEQMLYFLKGTVADDMPALIFTSRVRVAPASAAEQLAIKARDDDDEWIELRLA